MYPLAHYYSNPISDCPIYLTFRDKIFVKGRETIKLILKKNVLNKKNSIFNNKKKPYMPIIYIIHQSMQLSKTLLLSITDNAQSLLIISLILLIGFIISLLMYFMCTKKGKQTQIDADEKIKKLNNQILEIESNIHQIVKEKTLDLERELEEQRNYEEALNEALEREKESNFLKDSFLSNLSFGMRTPMNTIIGYADLLKEKNTNPEQKETYIQVINNSTKMLVNIINDILDISDIEAGSIKLSKEKFEVNALLDDIFNLFNSEKNLLHNDKIALNVIKSLENDKSLLNSDRTKIQLILSHLLTNAFKFTEEGKIEFGYTVKEHWIEFFVKDTGMTITEEEEEMIFEKFVIINRPNSRITKDSGLGMTIAKNYVELIGGNIWVETNLEKGTAFYFNIPFERNALTEQKSNLDNTKKEYHWNTKKILIVEDDKSSSKFLQEILKKTGAQILLADNGQKAVDVCMEEKNIDLILMDVQLPIMSGYEASMKIKETYPNIPIIAQTANAFADEKQKAIESGCNYYLTKPINKEKLFLIMETIFNQ